MKIKYLTIALFSLGLVCTSCGKKKKGDHNDHTKTEQHHTPIEDAHEGGHHDHGDHGHDHGGHDH